MSLNGRRVLVLAANLFEDTELLYPKLRLIEEGADVHVASMDGDPVTGKSGHGPLAVDGSVEDCSVDDFDALVIPGGFAPDAFRRSEKARSLTAEFDQAGKVVAFICHAGWLPISAKVIDGRRATSFSAIKDDMVNAGCDWVDEETVVDRNFISARHPGDLGPWCKAIIAALS